MRALSIMAAGISLVLAASAVADTRETMAANLAKFERFAGAPIDEIRSYRFYDWKPLGQTQFALWTRPNANVYIVEVERPCIGLDFARSISVSATGPVLSARFDRVSFDHQRCAIRSIRPVDYQAMRAARKAERGDRR